MKIYQIPASEIDPINRSFEVRSRQSTRITNSLFKRAKQKYYQNQQQDSQPCSKLSIFQRSKTPVLGPRSFKFNNELYLINDADKSNNFDRPYQPRSIMSPQDNNYTAGSIRSVFHSRQRVHEHVGIKTNRVSKVMIDLQMECCEGEDSLYRTQNDGVPHIKVSHESLDVVMGVQTLGVGSADEK